MEEIKFSLDKKLKLLELAAEIECAARAIEESESTIGVNGKIEYKTMEDGTKLDKNYINMKIKDWSEMFIGVCAQSINTYMLNMSKMEELFKDRIAKESIKNKNLKNSKFKYQNPILGQENKVLKFFNLVNLIERFSKEHEASDFKNVILAGYVDKNKIAVSKILDRMDYNWNRRMRITVLRAQSLAKREFNKKPEEEKSTVIKNQEECENNSREYYSKTTNTYHALNHINSVLEIKKEELTQDINTKNDIADAFALAEKLKNTAKTLMAIANNIEQQAEKTKDK